MYYYCKLYDIELEHWEIELIKKMDNIVIDMHNRRQEAEQKKQIKKK